MRPYIVIKEILNFRSEPSDVHESSFIGQALKGEPLFLEEREIVGVIPRGGTTNLWLSDQHNRFVAKEGVRPQS